MKRKLVSKSAFFTPRFLTGFAFSSIGLFLALVVFAHPNKPVEQQNKSDVEQSLHAFVVVALPPVERPSVPIASIKPVEFDGVIDLAVLGIHPATGPLPRRALSFGDAGSPDCHGHRHRYGHIHTNADGHSHLHADANRD